MYFDIFLAYKHFCESLSYKNCEPVSPHPSHVIILAILTCRHYQLMWVRNGAQTLSCGTKLHLFTFSSKQPIHITGTGHPLLPTPPHLLLKIVFTMSLPLSLYL